MPGLVLDDPQMAIHAIKKAALVPTHHQPLLSRVANAIPKTAKYILIGEASHGTEEFYRVRSELSKYLIKQRGFNAIAVEADFPDAFRANLYCRGLSTHDTTPEQALDNFIRFPTFMWRNTAVRDFIQWLRHHNDGIPGDGASVDKVGLYGIDIYSMHTSAKQVIEFLSEVPDPEAVQRATARYHCFDQFGEDAQGYAIATAFMRKSPCHDACVSMLKDMIEKRAVYAEKMDGEVGRERAFEAECNAAVVAGAEEYYRNMYFGDELTWNLRDTHFSTTIHRIINHLAQRMAAHSHHTEHPKLIIWAHNSHLGDARATDMGQRRGEVNLGQLMREQYGEDEVFSIGFTTHTGTVAAADDWGGVGQKKKVRQSMPGSYEHVFHSAYQSLKLPERFALKFKSSGGDGGGDREVVDEVRSALAGPLLERAIGVIYRPQTERQSHYFYAAMPDQFDMVIHIENTNAVRPLEPAHVSWEEEHVAKEDVSETYPFGV